MTTSTEKVALVTGSAMGIGLACAEAFAKAGYITVLADIKEPRSQIESLVAPRIQGRVLRLRRVEYADRERNDRMDCSDLRTFGCRIEQCRHPNAPTSDGGNHRRRI